MTEDLPFAPPPRRRRRLSADNTADRTELLFDRAVDLHNELDLLLHRYQVPSLVAPHLIQARRNADQAVKHLQQAQRIANESCQPEVEY